MGVVSGIVDGVLVLFSAVMAVAVPLLDAQVILPECYPPALAEVKRWYVEEYGDYLMSEKPHFFVGVMWMKILLLLPLSLANIYGIVARRPWAATTTLMAGVASGTSMAAIMAELLGSGRASEKLLQVYAPFVGFSGLAILKGLLSQPRRTTIVASHSASARKKRA